MKTVNLKSIAMAFALVSTMGLASLVCAEDIALPIISRPAILDEGTQKDLTADQIAELLPWANNSKKKLEELKENIQNLSAVEKVDALVEGIKTIVNESSVKNAELLMKYSLNRSLVINKILTKELNPQDIGTSDVKLRALKLSIEMALVYYSIDVENLNSKTKTQFAKFGIQYFDFLNEVNKSIFNASAQYKIQRTALEWLQWDLYRDLNNTKYAPQIVKINSNLKDLPNKKLSDVESIALIRKIKKFNALIDLTMSSNLEASKGVEPNNLLSCVKLKRDTLGTSRALDECSSEIKKSGFDYDAFHFQACIEKIGKVLNSSDASDECLKLSTVVPKFDYQPFEYRMCYSLVSDNEKKDAVIQVRECAKMMTVNTRIDFYNSDYMTCYFVYTRDYSPSEASQKCVDYAEKNIDLSSKKITTCYMKKYKENVLQTSTQMLEECIKEIY